MDIEPLTIAAYPEIQALWEATGLEYRSTGRDTREAIAAQLGTGYVWLFGIRDPGGKLVAALLLSHDSRKGWINRVAVLPETQGQGLGTRLCRFAEEWFEARGLELTAAQIELPNPASVRMFEKAGFVRFENLAYYTKRKRPDY